MTRFGIYNDAVTLTGFLTLIVLALCAYRVTRFAVADSLTAPVRLWLWRKAYRHGDEVYDSARDQMVFETVRRSMWWEKAFQLSECPFCAGVWLCALTWWAWFYWPWVWVQPAVTLGAVMGMQAFVGSREGA